MKYIITAATAVLLGTQVQAQHLSLGPSVGFGHAWMSGTDNDNTVRFKPTVNAGATFIYSVVPHFGIGADLRVHFMEGVSTRYSDGVTVEKTSLNATYLRLPIKFIYFFGNYGDRLRPKLYVGPSFGLLLGGQTVWKNDQTDSRVETNTRELLRDFDFGLLAGAGLNFRIQRATWLNLDLAYTHGLSDAGKVDGYQANRNISINAGVTFPIGKGASTAKK